MHNFLTSSVLAVASLACTAGIVAYADPANATLTPDARQAVVQVGDLDLGTQAGRQTAERRIHAAADRVCSSDTADLASSLHCRAKAIASAEQALGQQIAVR